MRNWICLLTTSILLISSNLDSTGILIRKQNYNLERTMKQKRYAKQQYEQNKQTQELQKNNAKLDTLLKQLNVNPNKAKKK